MPQFAAGVVRVEKGVTPEKQDLFEHIAELARTTGCVA